MKKYLSIFALALLLTACGNNGGLYMPDEDEVIAPDVDSPEDYAPGLDSLEPEPTIPQTEYDPFEYD